MVDFYRAFLIFSLAFSFEVFADQNIGRLFVDYDSPIVFDQINSSLVNSYPSEIRRQIKSYSAYSGGKSGGIEKIDIIAMELFPGMMVTPRNGVMRTIDAMRSKPGMRDFSYDVSEGNTSGYPSVRVRYKGLFKKAPVGGEILYVHDTGTSSIWSVSVLYFWEDGFFGNHDDLSAEASSVIDGIRVR